MINYVSGIRYSFLICSLRSKEHPLASLPIRATSDFFFPALVLDFYLLSSADGIEEARRAYTRSLFLRSPLRGLDHRSSTFLSSLSRASRSQRGSCNKCAALTKRLMPTNRRGLIGINRRGMSALPLASRCNPDARNPNVCPWRGS